MVKPTSDRDSHFGSDVNSHARGKQTHSRDSGLMAVLGHSLSPNEVRVGLAATWVLENSQCSDLHGGGLTGVYHVCMFRSLQLNV